MNAEIISEVGDPKQATCDAVQMWNITLLVLGGRGIGKIKRLGYYLLGTTIPSP